MNCVHPNQVQVRYRSGEVGSWIEVPCGCCMPCRITRTLEWTVRLQDHLQLHPGAAVFLTLTYSDDPLTLVPQDLVNFNRRFRYAVPGISYYSVGEYGGTSGRPHYHGIYFGFHYSSERDAFISSLWSKGFVFCGSVTRDSIQYVCGYIRKKLLGYRAQAEYYKYGLVPPFVRMSKNLGKDYFKANYNKVVSGRTLNGDRVIIPRYYKKMFSDLDKEYMRNTAEYREEDLRKWCLDNNLDYTKAKTEHLLMASYRASFFEDNYLREKV